ncbi:MAG: type II toxin-antitoxin system RelE/ParE family toxin [Hyphomicrobium sp.]
MIGSFRHRGLKRFFDDDDGRRLPADKLERIRSILTLLDAAEHIEDLDRPTLSLHARKGEFKGFWAVTVRANWRIIFRFENAQAFDVDFLDYH